jgi:hypothetical protein
VADTAYVLGSGAVVISWAAFTYVTTPLGGTCALTYAATTASVAAGLSAAVTVNNVARTLTVDTSTASLVSGTAYRYTVAVMTPSGNAVAGVTRTIDIVISGNAACEPPATVTATTTAA